MSEKLKKIDRGRRIKTVRSHFRETMIFRNRQQIRNHVELPLRKACVIFFDKNIFTTWSSADRTDAEARLVVDVSTMSLANRKKAEKFKIKGGRKNPHLDLTLPITPKTRIHTVSKHFAEIAAKFQHQPIKYAPGGRTLAEIREEEGWPSRISDGQLEIVLRRERGYYKVKGKFYLSRTIYLKMKE